jgi:hypothetical protein
MPPPWLLAVLDSPSMSVTGLDLAPVSFDLTRAVDDCMERAVRYSTCVHIVHISPIFRLHHSTAGVLLPISSRKRTFTSSRHQITATMAALA